MSCERLCRGSDWAADERGGLRVNTHLFCALEQTDEFCIVFDCVTLPEALSPGPGILIPAVSGDEEHSLFLRRSVVSKCVPSELEVGEA